jgi:hypothetical protein
VLRVRRAGVLALLALALACSSIPQGVSWMQNANFGTVRSLSKGHAYIDEYRSETGDVAWYHGHYYSTKAPGLALLAAGPYVVLHAVGIVGLMGHVPGAQSSEVGTLWLLTILCCVLPVLAALFLLRRLGDELSPGLGTAAALTLGLGTLLLPISTLFVDHALSASLGFVAFAVLRRRRERPLYCAAAGVLAGYAVSSEYPLAIVAIALALYVLLTAAAGSRTRRVAAYAAGLAVGVLPIVIFNWLAFGTPTHITYEDAVSRGGVTGHDVLGLNRAGFFGVHWPSFHVAVRLLFTHTGLLTLEPVVAVGAAGSVLLYRAGHRAEALLAGGLPLAFLIYNSGYEDPFGGWSPGPRFLVAMLPFLAIPLALCYRSWPLTTLALAFPSAVTMAAITATKPILAHDGSWYRRVFDGYFFGHGVRAAVPFALLVLAAIGFGALATRLPALRRRDPFGATAALLGWLLLAFAAPRLLREAHTGYVVLLALAVVALVVAAHRWTGPGRLRGRLEAA